MKDETLKRTFSNVVSTKDLRIQVKQRGLAPTLPELLKAAVYTNKAAYGNILHAMGGSRAAVRVTPTGDPNTMSITLRETEASTEKTTVSVYMSGSMPPFTRTTSGWRSTTSGARPSPTQ